MSFHSTILAKQQESNTKNYFDLEVEFFGIEKSKNKKIVLSEERFLSLINIINKFEENKNYSRTLDENKIFYNEILNEIATILKLEKKSVNNIEKSFDTICHFNKIFYNINVEITNYICFIGGQTTNSFFQTPLFTFTFVGVLPLELIASIFFILMFAQMFPLLSMISMIFLAFLVPFGSFIGHSLNFILLNQPIMLGSNIWLSNSNGWIQTVGLNGIKNNKGTFTGRLTGKGLFYEMVKAWIYGYSDPFEPFIGVKGFTGLRLNLDSENYESFYIGTALLVDVY